MGPKRRGKTRGSQRKSGSGSSSEDTEHQRTMDIINRLSKKYLRSSIKSDSEQQAKPHMGRKTRSSTSKPAANNHGYDGDAESNTASSQSDSSQMSFEVYDFMSTEEEELRLVLSPTKAKNKKSPKSGKKNDRKSSTTTTKKPVKSTKAGESAHKKSRKSKTNFQSDENEPVKVTPSEGVRGKKRKSIEARASSHGSFMSDDEMKGKMEVSQGDSGVFLSPPVIKRLRNSSSKAPKTVPSESRNAPTSTPSAPTKSIGGVDNCFGFDSLMSPPPDVSPVRRVITPLSDQGSSIMSNDTSLFSTLDFTSPRKANPGRLAGAFDSPDKALMLKLTPSNYHNKEKKRKIKKAISQNTAKYTDWAEKMSAEFNDIEMHELSIEG